MPTYEYRCPQGHLFELFQSMDDPPPAVCEVCGQGPVTRVFRPVPVFFKGSGFYSTDYGRGKRKRDSQEGDGTKPAEEAKPKEEKAKKKEAEAS